MLIQGTGKGGREKRGVGGEEIRSSLVTKMQNVSFVINTTTTTNTMENDNNVQQPQVPPTGASV